MQGIASCSKQYTGNKEHVPQCACMLNEGQPQSNMTLI